MAAATDHAGLVVLSFEECLELMATAGSDGSRSSPTVRSKCSR